MFHFQSFFRYSLIIGLILFPTSVFPEALHAAEGDPLKDVPEDQHFLKYILHQFDQNRKNDKIPKTLAEWTELRQSLREKIAENIGLYQENQCELNPRRIGTVQKEGYHIEKILLQTFPDIQVPTLAYVPQGKGPFPAVLCVHGHWAGAKQEPAIQSRCIGLAKLGFFVLAVDAFGAGERGIGKALGEYHGASVGASLFPSGRLLPGLQIYENKRFVDYLQSRKEVIKDRIGVTGASGGGNQTMYAGAMEDRFQAVVPVCSVGTYRSYLGAACCYCELIAGAMNFTEEWALLSMTAPRGLMVINATRDAIQFSPEQAAISIKKSKPIFSLYEKPNNVKHAIFESKHDYNKEMREAMYGWMTLHLKNEGIGEPIPEPAHETMKPEELRLFPGESRPNDFTTLLQFAKIRSQWLVDEVNQKWKSENWQEIQKQLTSSLKLKLNSKYRGRRISKSLIELEGKKFKFRVHPEIGVEIATDFQKGNKRKLAVLINPDQLESEKFTKLSESLSQSGWSVLVPELRSTGRYQIPNDKIREAKDHNSVEWSLWNGIPLLGQWVTDVRTLIDVAENTENQKYQEVVLVGIHSGAMIAITSGIFDQRVTKVAALNPLCSFVPNHPFDHDRLGILVPGILKEVGDVSHLCGLLAPKKLLVASGHLADGKLLELSSLEKELSPARQSYGWSGAENDFKVQPEWNALQLKEWVEK